MLDDRALMLALNVSDSAEDGPDVAIVHVTPTKLRDWIAEIDQARWLRLATQNDSHPHGVMYGVMYWDDSLYWLKGGGLAEDLAGVVDDGWDRLTPEQRCRVAAADRHHDAHAKAVRRFVTAEQVNWQAGPKHGPGDWTTARLSRDDLVELLSELTDPSHQAPEVPRTAGTPSELAVVSIALTDGDSVTRLEILPLATSPPWHYLTVFEGERVGDEYSEEEVVNAAVRLARLRELHQQLGRYVAAYTAHGDAGEAEGFAGLASARTGGAPKPQRGPHPTQPLEAAGTARAAEPPVVRVGDVVEVAGLGRFQLTDLDGLQRVGEDRAVSLVADVGAVIKVQHGATRFELCMVEEDTANDEEGEGEPTASLTALRLVD